MYTEVTALVRLGTARSVRHFLQTARRHFDTLVFMRQPYQPYEYDTPDLLDNIGKLHWLIDLSKDRPDQNAWRDEATTEMWRLIDELHRRGAHYPLPH